jgi:hypothetical protein
MRAAIFFLILFSLNLHAQRIKYFSVYTASSSVGVAFTIGAGQQCLGYTILHSSDSVNFSRIYDYPQTCGSTSEDVQITYTHTNPLQNQVNYYRIQLEPYEISQTRRIYVSSQPNANMILYPNPVYFHAEMLNAKMFNTTSTRFAGYIYNQFGTTIREVDVTTKSDVATPDISGLENGVYLLWLTDGSYSFSSKFIISR